MKYKLISIMAIIILRLIRLTCRYELRFENLTDQKLLNSGRFILAFFHQDEISLIPYFKNKNIGVLVSMSKDGEIMRSIANHFGYSTVRGSSSRGAVKGLISAIKIVRSGKSFAMAVDGPRGPIFKVKGGTSAISDKTQTPILPVRAIYSKAITSEKSWNKAKLPYPFSKIIIRVACSGMYSTNELESKLIELNQ